MEACRQSRKMTSHFIRMFSNPSSSSRLPKTPRGYYEVKGVIASSPLPYSLSCTFIEKQEDSEYSRGDDIVVISSSTKEVEFIEELDVRTVLLPEVLVIDIP